MKNKILFFITLFTLLSVPFQHETALALDHSGTISADETWGPADNPHHIIGNVIVSTGVTLTLLPGTEIFFDGSYYIRVDGAMFADGLESSPILFTKDTAYIGNWNQLQFYTGGIGSLSYCTIEYAQYGVNLTANAPITIDHCTIQFCLYQGIRYYQTAINPGHVITNNIIQKNNGYGIYFQNVTNAQVGEGNIIQNNENAGIYLNGCDNAQVAANNVIRRNRDYGLHIFSLDQPSILASEFSENGEGIFIDNCTNVGTLDNLTLMNNAEAAVSVENSGVFALGAGNAISGNGWPLSIDIAAFPSAASTIPATGNLMNKIRIAAGNSDKIGTLPAFPDLDYVLTANPIITASGSLTLSPGVTIMAQSNNYIRVDGEFNAVGTASDSIYFTRYKTDSWGGIRFYAGSQGAIQHSIFEYGYYGIYFSNVINIPVSESAFSHNTNGIYLDSGANISIARNEFIYNDNGVYIDTGGGGTIGGDGADFNCFEGNRLYAVRNMTASSIDAEYNYWGSPVGPNHASNPLGRGDLVSDNIDFLPYSWTCANICDCDLDRDGDCDGSDWFAFSSDWGEDCSNPAIDCECDIDMDGDCDGSDWFAFSDDWGRSDCP